MEDLTDATKSVYSAIIRHFREWGYSPSIRELCDEVGMTSSSSVYKHLNKLEAAGLIERIGPSRRIGLPRGKRK
jgi:repressor LexA